MCVWMMCVYQCVMHECECVCGVCVCQCVVHECVSVSVWPGACEVTSDLCVLCHFHVHSLQSQAKGSFFRPDHSRSYCQGQRLGWGPEGLL